MSNQVNTTVGLNVAQAGLAFVNGNIQIVGIQNPPLETTVVNGTPLIVADGIGHLNYANLNMLYMLSDELDITVGFYTGTDGSTGLIGSAITVYAGNPYVFANGGSTGGVGSNPLGTSNCGSIKITATLNINGVAQTAITQTDIHFRSSLSA